MWVETCHFKIAANEVTDNIPLGHERSQGIFPHQPLGFTQSLGREGPLSWLHCLSRIWVSITHRPVHRAHVKALVPPREKRPTAAGKLKQRFSHYPQDPLSDYMSWHLSIAFFHRKLTHFDYKMRNLPIPGSQTRLRLRQTSNPQSRQTEFYVNSSFCFFLNNKTGPGMFMRPSLKASWWLGFVAVLPFLSFSKFWPGNSCVSSSGLSP